MFFFQLSWGGGSNTESWKFPTFFSIFLMIPSLTHVSFKPLNEDRSSLIFPEGMQLSGNVQDKQDKTHGSTTSLGTQPLDRADELKSETPSSEEKR